ncbi:MAG TPA: cupin domain-containing protein [Jatrophihabitantaceae bacterium]|nr:cupin domain-containing protein [Jatrophihabitantaceae bacterium]
MSRKVRRVVTGCDEDGRSVIVLDDNPPAISVGTGEDARTVVEVWSTISTSASTLSDQKASSSVTTGLGANATEIRVVEMPPGCRREMHRTDTVDYGLVLSGELYVVLECGEMLLRAGDIIVQRGTNHLWHNRSDAPTRIAFVNMSGQTTDLSRCPDV